MDITKHELVPKHELLSKEKKTELLERLGIKESELPKVSSGDPAIASLEAKAGDIIRITRKSQTAGEALYYRVVV